MTTPGGVSNLPPGALTEATLADQTQDMSSGAMTSRAAERFPNIFNSSTGGNPLLDLTPLGILVRIFAAANSSIANADPNDIQGPDDIPDLLLAFINGLPVVGQFDDLLRAINGEYEGEDPVLNAVQDIFAPIRALLQLFAGITSGFPTAGQVTDGYNSSVGAAGTQFDAIDSSLSDLEARVTALESP